jgi:MFS family permease
MYSRQLSIFEGHKITINDLEKNKNTAKIFFQYGFVFGIANLAAFLSAPVFGRYGPKIGPKVLYNFGAFLQVFISTTTF